MTKHEYEEIMKQWDSWAKYYREGGTGSCPRDAFETLIDYLDGDGILKGIPQKWEKIDDNSDRLWIPQGWIVRSWITEYEGGAHIHQIIVDDPEHEWVY